VLHPAPDPYPHPRISDARALTGREGGKGVAAVAKERRSGSRGAAYWILLRGRRGAPIGSRRGGGWGAAKPNLSPTRCGEGGSGERVVGAGEGEEGGRRRLGGRERRRGGRSGIWFVGCGGSPGSFERHLGPKWVLVY
jgi:hypothetical protein